MTAPLTDQTRRYIEKRIAAGVTAAQIQTELKARSIRVPFAQLLDFDAERKGASELKARTREEMRALLQRCASSQSSPNSTAV